MEGFLRRTFVTGSVAILLAACSHNWVANTLYSVGVSGEGNRVSIAQNTSISEGANLIDVESMSGIGQATIAGWGETSPHPIVYQMHLHGLEGFTLQWADKIVAVEVNSADGAILQSVQFENGDQTAIDATSPYWIDLLPPSPERSAFVLKEPDALSLDRPRIWSISWVDFYR